nr:YciI family protein [uncultured Allomuricauda sp.]
MEFILIVKSKGVEPTRQDMQVLLQNYGPWMQKYSETGNYLAGSPFQKDGALLKGENKVHMEGDFLEGVNLLTGYIHLEAENLERAIKISQECPLLDFNDITIMPILEMK